MTITNNSDLTGSEVYVAGHRKLAGSAIMRRLEREVCAKIFTWTHTELDLVDQWAVISFFTDERPENVFLALANVGGILANNTGPTEFIQNNLAIQTNVIQAARDFGVKWLLFLGSSCIYPRDCPHPTKEEYVLTGPLEPTNLPYAKAKIAGIEICWAFNHQYGTQYIAAMPTNLCGTHDNYDLTSSHVPLALLRKMHEAKVTEAAEVFICGTGSARREFLHSDDIADPCVFMMNLPDEVYGSIARSESLASLLNVGFREDLTVREFAELIRDVVGLEGQLAFGTSRHDGTPRNLLDASRMNELGWQANVPLRQGITGIYSKYSTIFAAQEILGESERWSE
jgi:GDP-L-fucose synthase